jgi:hypothetical protein
MSEQLTSPPKTGETLDSSGEIIEQLGLEYEQLTSLSTLRRMDTILTISSLRHETEPAISPVNKQIGERTKLLPLQDNHKDMLRKLGYMSPSDLIIERVDRRLTHPDNPDEHSYRMIVVDGAKESVLISGSDRDDFAANEHGKMLSPGVDNTEFDSGRMSVNSDTYAVVDSLLARTEGAIGLKSSMKLA